MHQFSCQTQTLSTCIIHKIPICLAFFSSFPAMVSVGLGGNVTLPCRYMHEDGVTPEASGLRIKWIKVADDEALNEDVLTAMGFHITTFGNFENRVYMEKSDSDDASLLITDVGMADAGKYRCEIINGADDKSQLVRLEVKSGQVNGKSYSFMFT